MKNVKYTELLKNIGLSEEESAIYLAGLSLGPTTILKLSKSSGLKRTTVYGIVEGLKRKGLMRIDLKGLKQTYAVESPEKLESTLEGRVADLKRELPSLMALHNLQGSESAIKYYTGLEAMKQLYLETLKEIKHGEDYLVIANQEKWYNLDPKFSQFYIEERAKLSIKTRLLFQDSPLAREQILLNRNFNQEARILPSDTNLNVDTLLLPNKLITLELTPPYMTVVIENKGIIELHREMFELIWKSIHI